MPSRPGVARCPANGYRNVRRVLLHTLNLSDMLPITSVWAGLRENPSQLMPRHSPPLMYASTSGATPFRLNLHVSDLGHTAMCGPSGAGKSTLLAMVTAQWFRYPGAQVFAFDKGYSLYVLTNAAGGEFYDITGEKTHLAFCPLREIDSDADLAWAVGWLEGLCVLQGGFSGDAGDARQHRTPSEARSEGDGRSAGPRRGCRNRGVHENVSQGPRDRGPETRAGGAWKTEGRQNASSEGVLMECNGVQRFWVSLTC
jgi:hypothetical protein